MYDILLVDDEPIFLEFLQAAIDWGALGCRICACREDGAKALEYIMEYEPNIAFLDICMPNKDGLEVCGIVRERNLPTKLIIMTGHDEFTFAYQAIKLEIDDYLLKPFTAEELTKSLQKTMAKIEQERVQAAQAGQREPRPSGAVAPPATKSDLLIRKIDEYLLANYQESELTQAQVAAALQYDSSYLRRVYKQKTGMTIFQRLEAIRIARAKELLASGLYWNKEVAYLTGFSDPYYFSKRFKQVSGYTPTEFRK